MVSWSSLALRGLQQVFVSPMGSLEASEAECVCMSVMAVPLQEFRMGTGVPGQHSAADSAVNFGLASCPGLVKWVVPRPAGKMIAEPPPVCINGMKRPHYQVWQVLCY